MEHPSPQRFERNDFELGAFLRANLKYVWLFAVSIPLFLAIAWFYNWYAIPLYSVSTKVMIDDQANESNHYLKELELDPKSKVMENEIEVLRSQSLIAETVSRLEFDVSYFLIGNFKVSEVYRSCPFRILSDSLAYEAYFKSYDVLIDDVDGGRFSVDHGGDQQEFAFQFDRPFQMPQGRLTIEKRSIFDEGLFSDPDYEKRRFEVRFNTVDQSKNAYLSKLKIEKAREGSTILELSLLDEVPLKAMDFLDTLVEVYIETDRKRKNNAVMAKSDFIDDQLAVISKELNQVELDDERYKSSKGIVNLDAESVMLMENAYELDEKIVEGESQARMIRYLEDYVSTSKQVSDLAPSTLDIRDPLLAKLISDLNELENERKETVLSNKEGSPALGAIDSKIDRTKAAILESAKNIRMNVEEGLVASRERKQELDKKISRIPGAQRELKNIERELSIKQNLYLYMLEKQAEVSISLASSPISNRVLDRARTRPGPVSPVPSRAYSIALLLGLLLPSAFIFLRERLKDTISGRKMIERLCSVPIIGTLGVNKSDSGLVIQNRSRSALAESFRAVRTNLKYFTGDSQQRVILVTSSVGGEGKTFTAMNIAGSFAIAGSRTVLLGLDLRKPKISDDLDVDSSKGISSYLINMHGLDEVTQASKEIPGLDIIPSGPVPPNPSELIMTKRMTDLMHTLKEKYDYIVIDSPPIGLVTDGFLLAKYADASIYILRQNFSKRQHLKMLDEVYRQNKLPHLSILFNAVEKDLEGGYGGYGHGYGYGYYEDEESSSATKQILHKTKELLSEN